MGSSHIPERLSISRDGVPSSCPLHALGPGSGGFRATCDVTNKINIDKYFELMKEEYSPPSSSSTSLKTSTPPCRTLSRSVSSSNIEPLMTKAPNSGLFQLSPRRKKNIKKRISCDEKSLAVYAAHNSMPKHTENHFNYDLSGQMVKAEGNHSENHNISKQKSWDLSNSKRKNMISVNDDNSDEEEYSDLSLSYSVGDFRGLLKKDENNNEVVKSSKSCDSISKLGERHKEYAMMQGQIGSVSEENRRHRRKVYRKKGKKRSTERPASFIDDSTSRINHLLMEKLVIDVG